MNSRKITVAWLAPYRIQLLEPELVIARRSKGEHACSWIVNLADALAKRGDIDLHVVTASAGIKEGQTLRKGGITFHVVRHTFPLTIRGFPEYMRFDVLTQYMALRRRIKQIVLQLRPDLIHVHGTEYGYGLAALKTNTPAIISIQGIINLLAGVSPSVFYRLQSSIELNVVRDAKYFGSRTAWANSFVRNVNHAAIIYDLPEAVSDVFFRTAAGQLSQNILMVGTVVQRKGIEEALDAMRMVVTVCPSSKLLVVGEGNPDYVAGLKERTKSAGIDAHVEWLGFQTAEQIAALHATAAILIHPSYLDNSPNSVAEAMASGLPVIASRVGGIPSMIEHNVTGLLVESRSHRELAAAITALLRDESERKRLASMAKRIAVERHLPSSVADKALRIYQDIIAKERKG